MQSSYLSNRRQTGHQISHQTKARSPVHSLSMWIMVGVLGAAVVGCGQDSGVTANTAKANTADTTKAAAEPTAEPATKLSGDEADVAANLQANLAKSGIHAKVDSILSTKMPDIYIATLQDMAPIFTDKTGQFIIQGQIIQVGGESPIDIGNEINSTLARTELAKVDKSEMIIFPATGETKAAIYVFSDPTCHYCQLLHSEIKATNAAGIEVRYLAWPRSEQMIGLTETIWCSSDRNAAITAAKSGSPLPTPVCADNPVRKHIELGFKLGVSGTPAVFAENGTQLGGYLPSARLAAAAIANKN
ncbi:MAG: DsbC family protein [Moraxella sp.]|nr:DsbC family protein [Moraxella sp.]